MIPRDAVVIVIVLVLPAAVTRAEATGRHAILSGR